MRVLIVEDDPKVAGAVKTGLIDVHITRLRKKVDQGFSPRLIHTIRGVGFLVKEGEP